MNSSMKPCNKNWQASTSQRPPTAPTQLALAVILQAYTGVSDDDVIEATVMDRRWQLALDYLDPDQAPFEPRNVRCFSQTLDRTDDRACQPEPGIWITSLTGCIGQQPIVGSRESRRHDESDRARAQKAHRRGG